MPPTDVSLIGRHPAYVFGVLAYEVRVEVAQRPSHLVGVLLVYAENYRLGEAVGAFQEVGQVARYRFRARAQRHCLLEVLGVVVLVGDLASEAVELALARAPSGGVHARYYPMYPVRCQETVLDALLQAVLIDGVSEVAVGSLVVGAQGGGCHAELVGGLEVLQDLTPVALVPGAPPVAFVYDDQIEEVRRELPVESRTPLVLRDGLVDGEVHLPTLADLAVLDLPP